jgi:hypothetical protein
LGIEISPTASEKGFWNAKAERHEVAIAEGKYRAPNIAKG